MAIRKQSRVPLNAIEVISEHDDAVDREKSDMRAYRESGDRKHLVFVEGKQPTVFLCNFELKGMEAAGIKNSMLGGKDDEGQPAVAFGTWTFKVVKYALKDIQNPADVPDSDKLVYRKDDKGYTHDELISELERLGIVNEIFGMYTALALGGARANAKN